MGTHFFAKAPGIGAPSGTSLEARSMGSAVGAARAAGLGAQKDLGAAAGINKGGYGGPSKRSAAYAPGPKRT